MHKISGINNEKYFDTNADVNLALWQMRSKAVELGLPSKTNSWGDCVTWLML